MPENGRTVGVLHRPSTRTDIISAIGRGGANLVNTTVRPSGVNVEANTSPVDTTPGANTTAESVGLSGVATRARGELAHAANESDATTKMAARARDARCQWHERTLSTCCVGRQSGLLSCRCFEHNPYANRTFARHMSF